ncbi:MAG: zinc-ribbon domain-containing protein, partial [Candidatus Fibromonas sp.]|nr:zinc-ribbon domain-containing protein [Candidatus Fibromonas sp.]
PVFCANCGKPIEGGVKFCPSCGASTSGKTVRTEAHNQGLQQADPNDAEQNKGMAAIAYFLFFVPIITGDHKRSPFVMFHTNQGMVLFITYVAMWIASSILVSILYRVFAAAIYRSPLGSWGLLSLFGLITPLFSIVMLVLFIIGIVNALNGRMKPLPIIGRITLIK